MSRIILPTPLVAGFDPATRPVSYPGLAFVLLPSGANIIDGVAHDFGTKETGTQPVASACALGRSLYFADGASVSPYVIKPIKAHFGTDDFALLVVGTFVATANTRCCFSNNDATQSSLNYQWRVMPNRNAAGSNESGAFYFYTYDGSTTSAGVSSAFTTGEYCTFLCCRRGTTLEIWKNGRLLASNTGTIRAVSSSIYTTRPNLGLFGNSSYTAGGHRVLNAAFHKTVSQEEARSLSANPWQIFATPSRVFILPPITAQETLRPDVIETQTGCSGAVSNLQNDPDSGTDGNWVTADSDSGNIDLIVSFPDASGTLKTGTGLQEIRALVANSVPSNTPDNVTMTVWEGDPTGGGSLIATLVNTNDPTYGSGQVIFGTWDAADLSDQSASSDVRVRIQCTADASPAPQVSSLDVDSIEWNVTYYVGGPVSPTGTGTLTSGTATLSGIGSFRFTGTSTLTSGTSTLSGSGKKVFTGTSTLTSGTATLSGTGKWGVNGTSTLISGTATLSGIGKWGVNGTSTLISGTATLSGTGSFKFTGTSTLTSGTATLSGTGKKVFTGTSTLTSGTATLSGTGAASSAILGSGTLTSGTSTLSGTGKWGVNGTSTLTSGTATFTGSGIRIVIGTSDLISGIATLSGIGSFRFTGTSTLTSGTATLSGTGAASSAILGSGTLTSGTTTLLGTGKRISIGTSTLTSGTATFTGSGSTAGVITGTSNLISSNSTLSGSGQRVSVGTSSLESGTATLSSSGKKVHTGSANLVSEQATLSGTGVASSAILGNGVLISGTVTFSGSGIRTTKGSGDLVSGTSLLSGAGTLYNLYTGIGSFTSANSTLVGTGKKFFTGTSSLTSGTATLSGSGTKLRTGTGNLVSNNSTLSVQGTRYSIGSSSLVSGTATLSGIGKLHHFGITCNLQSSNATLSGTGQISSLFDPNSGQWSSDISPDINREWIHEKEQPDREWE